MVNKAGDPDIQTKEHYFLHRVQSNFVADASPRHQDIYNSRINRGILVVDGKNKKKPAKGGQQNQGVEDGTGNNSDDHDELQLVPEQGVTTSVNGAATASSNALLTLAEAAAVLEANESVVQSNTVENAGIETSIESTHIDGEGAQSSTLNDAYPELDFEGSDSQRPSLPAGNLDATPTNSNATRRHGRDSSIIPVPMTSSSKEVVEITIRKFDISKLTFVVATSSSAVVVDVSVTSGGFQYNGGPAITPVVFCGPPDYAGEMKRYDGLGIVCTCLLIVFFPFLY